MNVDTVISGIDTLSLSHGGTVHDHEGGDWDWGQAVCRELYGHDWMSSPKFHDHEMRHEEDGNVDFDAVKVVRAWLAGDFPGWFEAVPPISNEGRPKE